MPGPVPSTSNSAQRKPNGGARFELPQLTPVNYSLTEGTDIPPPPDSPIEEAPPAPKPEPREAAKLPNPLGDVTSPASPTTNGNGTYEGRGRTSNADQLSQPPLSPASSTRPGSIRRFLSRRSLNTHYANGTNKSTDDLSMIERPGTSLEKGHNGVVRPKRSSSWFRRFGSSSNGNAGNRTSIVYEEERKVEKKGPPPPTLPELKLDGGNVGKDESGSLGAEELFKNIK